MSRLKPEFLLRTKAYASAIIRLFALLPKEREEVRVLGRQMLRAGTSVAAQVREANRGRSRAEFVAKLGGALQERQTKPCFGWNFYGRTVPSHLN